MNLQDWETYLTTLCTNHPLVLHNTNGRRAFIPYESPETSLVHSDLSTPYVRHVAFFFNGRTESQWYYSSTLLFMVDIAGIDELNRQEAIVEARATAQQILEQFEARMWYDHNTGNTCTLLEDIVEVAVEPVEMTDQQAYGWELTVTIAARKIDHDTELWLDTKTPD
jgi:hypothetical protein